jgi:Spy/CpxP family protein refolding chaperone
MRKVAILTLFIMVALVLTLTITVGAASPKAAAVAVAPAPASAVAAPMPPHPHITEGLEAMHAAKHHLEMADHDFHGHRAKAIEHLDQAIHEAEICEQEP